MHLTKAQLLNTKMRKIFQKNLQPKWKPRFYRCESICNVNSQKMIDMCRKITSKRKYFGISLCTAFFFFLFLYASLLFNIKKQHREREVRCWALITLSDGCLEIYFGGFSEQRTWNLSFYTPSPILSTIAWRIKICKKYLRLLLFFSGIFFL